MIGKDIAKYYLADCHGTKTVGTPGQSEFEALSAQAPPFHSPLREGAEVT